MKAIVGKAQRGIFEQLRPENMVPSSDARQITPLKAVQTTFITRGHSIFEPIISSIEAQEKAISEIGLEIYLGIEIIKANPGIATSREALGRSG